MEKKKEFVSEKLKSKVENLLKVHSGLFNEIQKDIDFRILELKRISKDIKEMEKMESPVEIYETASAILDAMEQNHIGNSYQRNMFAGFSCDVDDLTVDFDKLPIISGEFNYKKQGF